MILEMPQTPAKARKVAGSKCSPRIPLTQWSDWHLPHHCPMPWVPAAASLVEVAKLSQEERYGLRRGCRSQRESASNKLQVRNSKPESQLWINRGVKLLCNFCLFLFIEVKKKISPAGVALSMVPILGKSSQIATYQLLSKSQTWRMRNTKLQK